MLSKNVNVHLRCFKGLGTAYAYPRRASLIAQALACQFAGAIILFTNCAIAEIVPDSTLPNNSHVKLEGNTRIISGGTTRGANLFHSFSEFSVPTNSTALFNNAEDIQNIISRVTGNSISNIDGLIRSLGKANLFLINPNGIIFAQNARLEIGGSFFATSANSMKFADGFEFDAKNPQPTPLLTISVPIGLQFGANPGLIQVRGNRQVTRTNDSPMIDTQDALRVQPDKTLALVGGNINIEGATLNTAGGRIELGSVTGNSLVSLISTNPGWLLGYQGITNFQNIRLTDGANIAVNGDAKGSIAINANNIDIHSGSNLKAGIDAGFQFLDTQAGDITLNARGIVSVDEGTIANEVRGIGNGGNINITGRSLFFSNGAIVSANSLGQGNTGNVTINARDAVSLDGVGSSRGTVITATLLGTGNGGKIAINAPKVSLLNGATIVSHTNGQGNAGSIEISAADDISINGVGTGVGSQVFANGVGNGGTITINAPKVFLSNGATIAANTYGQGNAGSIKISAVDDISRNGVGTGVGSQVFANGVGNGGTIAINAPKVSLSNGATIVSHTNGQGNAGSIKISAADDISIDGIGTGVGSQVFANGVGNGGTIAINAPKVSLSNGAAIIAHTNAQGNAGSIEISAADDISINGVGTGVGSQVFANGVGNGGTIAINAPKVSLLNGATIVSHTNGRGNAGNITINANKVFLDGVGSNGESSGLGSAAFQLARGNGGAIIINTGSLAVTNGASLFASSFAQKDAGSVTINATGAVSFDGVGANGLSSNAFSTVELGSTGNGREIKITANSLSVKNAAIIGATTSGQGNGGNININVSTLQVQGGGQILTTSRNRGNAGEISVNATDSITIIGSDQTFPERLARIGRPDVRNEGAASGIFANTDVNSTGSGGNINVTTQRLSINEGALVNATSQGYGVAGNINAKARSIRLDNNATISADTRSINTDLNKPQATINIRSRDLILLHSSNITTDAKGENVIGGNININTDVLAGFENSDITANSTDFRGGNIEINTKGIFGIQFRDIPSPQTSDITATGASRELSGNVEITTLDVDLTNSLMELPINLVDVSRLVDENVCARTAKSSFTYTGRGGLPPSPNNTLNTDAMWEDWRLTTVPRGRGGEREREREEKKLQNPNFVNTSTGEIVEAQGWVVDTNGDVILVAHVPAVTPHKVGSSSLGCQPPIAK